MTAIRHKTDWDSVRQRLAGYQAQATDSDAVRGERLAEVFRQRARDLERRGGHETAKASRLAVVVFHLGKERFGIPLTDLKQVFSRVSSTPIPGRRDLLVGVANLNGVLRSIVDLNALLHTAAANSENGYIVLLRIAERSLALRIDTLEGVSEVDLTSLVPVDEAAPDGLGTLMRGMTEGRVIVLDTEAVMNRVKEQLHTGEP